MTLQIDGPTQVVEATTSYIANYVAPVAAELDERGVFNPGPLQRAAEIGLTRLLFDDDDNINLQQMRLTHDVTEMVASASPAVSMQISATRVIAYLIAKYAEPEVRSKWLRATLDGSAHGSFGLTESHAGTDLRGISTTVRRQGDHYILSGSKCWIGFAAVSSYAVVLAKLESEDRAADTVALLVEMDSAGASGADGPAVSGMRGISNGTLTFDNVRVPASHALRVDGFAGMMDALNLARIDAASLACGLLRSALDASVERAATRSAFGKRLGDLPTIQAKLGRMRAAYHAARELTLRAGETFMAGDGGDQDVISMAKMTASDLAREHTDQAMQIYAAAGFVSHSPVERMHRDAKGTQIFDGTSEIHEIMVGRRLVQAFAPGKG
jgi:alkylation response protein AidB-like acyl-CoA dehydrogenase